MTDSITVKAECAACRASATDLLARLDGLKREHGTGCWTYMDGGLIRKDHCHCGADAHNARVEETRVKLTAILHDLEGIRRAAGIEDESESGPVPTDVTADPPVHIPRDLFELENE